MNITINDKEYPLSWGLGAIEIYCDAMGCDIDGLSMVEDTSRPVVMQKALVTLVQAALKNAQEIEGKTLDLSYRQLQNYLSEVDQNVFKSILDDFVKSRYMGKTVGEYIFGVQPETEEKKSELASAE